LPATRKLPSCIKAIPTASALSNSAPNVLVHNVLGAFVIACEQNNKNAVSKTIEIVELNFFMAISFYVIQFSFFSKKETHFIVC